jgi:hypothetical protein
MVDVGDASNGFSIVFDQLNQTLRVTGWGFWSAEIATQFAPAVAGEVTKRSCTGVAFDFRRLVPMREEGQDGWARLMRELDGRVRTVTVATRSKLTKLQLLRLAKPYDTKLGVKWIENDESGGTP